MKNQFGSTLHQTGTSLMCRWFGHRWNYCCRFGYAAGHSWCQRCKAPRGTAEAAPSRYGWPDHHHLTHYGNFVGGVVEDRTSCSRCHLEAGYAAGYVAGSRDIARLTGVEVPS